MTQAMKHPPLPLTLVLFLTACTSPCKNLHKVTSRDDLLKQLYETAYKNDCVFDMSAEELQEIWQVPVSDDSFRYQYSVKELREDFTLGYYPEQSPFDFYVYYYDREDASSIGLSLTQDALRSGHYTLFPENDFPDFLEKPSEDYTTATIPGAFHVETPYEKHPEQGIQHYHAYQWKRGLIYYREMGARTQTDGEVFDFVFRDTQSAFVIFDF